MELKGTDITRMRNFVLDVDGRPVETQDLALWTLWMATHNREIQKDVILQRGGPALEVVTVFFGMDACQARPEEESDAPCLFGTFLLERGARVEILGREMFERKRLTEEPDLYRTRDEALEGHRRHVAAIRMLSAPAVMEEAA
jgi:hypothetical protein